jgi:hypothetical protein
MDSGSIDRELWVRLFQDAIYYIGSNWIIHVLFVTKIHNMINQYVFLSLFIIIIENIKIYFILWRITFYMGYGIEMLYSTIKSN